MKKLDVFVSVLLGMVLMLGVAGGCSDDKETSKDSIVPEIEKTVADDSIVLKFPHAYTEDSAKGRIVQYFADLLEQYTEGRVTCEIFPRSILMMPSEEFGAIQTGLADVVITSSYFISPQVKDVLIFMFQGMWESWEHGFAVMDDGRIPQNLSQQIEDGGIGKVLSCIPPSDIYIAFMSDAVELAECSDYSGVKFGQPPGGMRMAFDELCGAVSVPVPLEEQVTALQQGLIELIIMSPCMVVQYRQYDVAHHGMFGMFGFIADWLIMNQSTWDKLPTEVQDILINQVVPEVDAFARDILPKGAMDDLAFLEDYLDTAHYMSPETHPQLYDDILYTEISTFFKGVIDPEIIRIVDELRPSRQQN